MMIVVRTLTICDVNTWRGVSNSWIQLLANSDYTKLKLRLTFTDVRFVVRWQFFFITGTAAGSHFEPLNKHIGVNRKYLFCKPDESRTIWFWSTRSQMRRWWLIKRSNKMNAFHYVNGAQLLLPVAHPTVTYGCDFGSALPLRKLIKINNNLRGKRVQEGKEHKLQSFITIGIMWIASGERRHFNDS